jgi:hypothetical protein
MLWKLIDALELLTMETIRLCTGAKFCVFAFMSDFYRDLSEGENIKRKEN